MDLANQLKALADKIDQLKNSIHTEEATKTAFVLPFINLLGYDIFNPTEVVPEFVADLGTKKGEKVDYAIFQDGIPILIIECKKWDENLDVHSSQLFRYFHVTKTRFSLLTNGIEFRFYTDLEEPNKMDVRPFLEFSIPTLKETTITEIAKFHKSNFDVTSIVDNASSLKYTKEIKKILEAEFKSPTVDFVRLFASKVYNGRLTEKVLDQFTEVVQKAVTQFISEKVSDRLTSALSKEVEQQQEEETVTEVKSDIITTDEELEAFRIIVAILRRKIEISRIKHRDTKSYFGILLDDNNRKPICRLHLNTSNKYLGLFDNDKNEEKMLISEIDDIYQYEDRLLATINLYD